VDGMGTGEKSLQVGEVVECRYHVVSGGTPQDLGTVYKAHDVRHDRPVTILVLSRRFGTGFEALKRIAQANQTVTELQIPALVPLEYVGLVDGQPYLVHRPLAEQSLAELEHQVDRLKLDVALEIAVRLCDALIPLHRAGLAHGGLSSHAVWLEVREEIEGEQFSLGVGRSLGPGIAVTEAGLVPALQSLFAAPGQPWGRLPYLSPEQAAGNPVHPSTDVYVIGSLLYEMLTGRPPFRAGDEMVLALQHLRQDPPLLEIWAPEVSPAVSQIIQKTLAKEPAARYRNAGQLAYALRAQQVQLQAERSSPPIPDQARLIVPPPPAPETRSHVRRYELWEEDGNLSEEADGVDWLMVALAIVAAIAVLGLIPLWRTVYQRYAVPVPLSAPSSYYWSERDRVSILLWIGETEGQATSSRWLDDFGLVWYNSWMPGVLPMQLVAGSRMSSQKASVAGDAASDLGRSSNMIMRFGSQAYRFGKQNEIDCQRSC
jgi:serine/threonine protein kinase